MKTQKKTITKLTNNKQNKLKVMTIVGTRPEIIRLSRTMALLDQYVNHIIVHTGQNYDYELNEIFFNELELRKPDYFLNVDTATLGSAVGDIIKKSEEVLIKENPDALLVLGDTNSCLSAYIAKRMHIPIFHMEAGNRCFDFNVPEEINRRIIDHIADFNLVYTEHARRHLLSEGLPHRRIYLTGSPMNEVLSYYLPKINESKILESLSLKAKRYFVVSTHREENVDNPENLKKILDVLKALSKEYDYPIIVSTHPRTRKRLNETSNLKTDKNIKFLKPFGFLDYVNLQTNAACTISDSGTISEESAILSFPAISLRESMERPEAQDSGSIILTGFDEDVVLSSINALIKMHLKNKFIQMPIDYEIENTSCRVLNLILGNTKLSNKWWGIYNTMNTLIVLGSLTYPEGSAPTNRIHLYCKAMIESGSKAYVLSISSPFTTNKKFPILGRYQGVPYIFTQRKYMREKSFVFRNLRKLYGIFNACFVIKKIFKKNKKCAILFFSTNLLYEIVFKLFSLFYKIPIIREANEAPLFLRKNNFFFLLNQVIYESIRVRLYDSLIVISKYLYNYYSKICPEKVIIKIPILVDFNRFDNIETSQDGFMKYITYVGYMGGNKDGLMDLLSAISLVCKSTPNIKLKLIGPAPTMDIKKIMTKIRSLDIEKIVDILGQIDISEIPFQLKKSTILVLARPNHIQAQAGFPTKLGEYLAAKKPVVITNTGEIPNYLVDGESAYIAEPGNIKHIALKIIEALNDVNAEIIAKNGYDVARTNFNYQKYYISLNDLISDIQKK